MPGNHDGPPTAGGGVPQGFETHYLGAPNDLFRMHPEKADGHGRLPGKMYVAAPGRSPPPGRIPLGERDLEMPVGVDSADPQDHTDKPPENTGDAQCGSLRKHGYDPGKGPKNPELDPVPDRHRPLARASKLRTGSLSVEVGC